MVLGHDTQAWRVRHEDRFVHLVDFPNGGLVEVGGACDEEPFGGDAPNIGHFTSNDALVVLRNVLEMDAVLMWCCEHPAQLGRKAHGGSTLLSPLGKLEALLLSTVTLPLGVKEIEAELTDDDDIPQRRMCEGLEGGAAYFMDRLVIEDKERVPWGFVQCRSGERQPRGVLPQPAEVFEAGRLSRFGKSHVGPGVSVRVCAFAVVAATTLPQPKGGEGERGGEGS